MWKTQEQKRCKTYRKQIEKKMADSNSTLLLSTLKVNELALQSKD